MPACLIVRPQVVLMLFIVKILSSSLRFSNCKSHLFTLSVSPTVLDLAVFELNARIVIVLFVKSIYFLFKVKISFLLNAQSRAIRTMPLRLNRCGLLSIAWKSLDSSSNDKILHLKFTVNACNASLPAVLKRRIQPL